MRLKKTVHQLLHEANAEITTLSPTQARALIGSPDVIFVDIRDADEIVAHGKISGAVHAPRGALEWIVDPASARHNPIFAQDKHFVIY